MPPLRVEYAKSARSKCANKQCSEFIEKGELRIGTGNMMPGADELSYKWRHLCCFTKKQLANVTGIDNLEGFDDLQEVDQKRVMRMLKGDYVDKTSIKGTFLNEELGGKARSPSPAKKGPKGMLGEFGISDDDSADDVSPSPRPAAAAAKPKAKKAKDPNAPKKPMSAFFFFSKEMQKEVKDNNPGVPAKDIKKLLGKMWDELADEEGKPFRELARKDKKRYEEEREAYEKKLLASAEKDGDSDDDEPAAPPAKVMKIEDEDGAVGSKPVCKYGADCYRTNPAHRSEYYHPPKEGTPEEEEPSPPPAKPAPSPPRPPPARPGAKKCPWGINCFRTAPSHFADFSHEDSE